MLRDKAGNRLFRKVTVKIVPPDNVFPEKTLTQHAGPHQGFGQEGIDEILMRIADQLDYLYPYWDFKLIELAPAGRTARYVLNFVGYKSSNRVAQPIFPDFKPDSQPQESTTLGPETTKEEVFCDSQAISATTNSPTEVGNSL